MAEREDEVQSLLLEAEETRARLEMVTRQVELLTALRDDKRRAHETLEGVKTAKVGAEILVPVGGNTFVTATVKDTAAVLKGVGASYVLPRPLDVAVQELKKETDAMESDLAALAQNARSLEIRYQQLAAAVSARGGGDLIGGE